MQHRVLKTFSLIFFLLGMHPGIRAETLALHEGAADPVGVEGWEKVPGFNPGVTGEAIDDAGTPAWRVYDPVAAGPSGGGAYQVVPTPEEHARAKSAGWTFSSTLRLVDTTTPVETSTVGITYRNGAEAYQLAFGVNGGVINVIWVRDTFPNTTGPRVALPGLALDAYHSYALVYDPTIDRCRLYINDEEVMNNLSAVPLAQSMIAWGAMSSTWIGEAHFSQVEFEIHEGTPQPPRTTTEWLGIHEGALDPEADEGWQSIALLPGTASEPVNDAGTLAWRTADPVSANGAGAYYFVTPTADQHARAKVNGWTFSFTMRIVNQSVPVDNASITAAYRNGTENFQLAWGVNDGQIHMMWVTGTAGRQLLGPRVVLPGVQTDAYHRYDLVFDPDTQRAALSVDGVERMNNLKPSFLSQSHLGWGAGSSFNIGEANWAAVSFGIHARNTPDPSGNLVIAHKGKKHPVNEENWIADGGFTPNVLAGPTDDDGTLAWCIDDDETITSSPGGGVYTYTPTVEQHALAAENGWTFRNTLRIIDTSVPVENASITAAYRNGSENYQLAWGVNGGVLNVKWVTDTSGATVIGPTVALPGLSIHGYHQYDLIYDPVSDQCHLEVNGESVMEGLSSVPIGLSEVVWGAGSSINTGEACFSCVSFRIHDRKPPPRPRGDCLAEHLDDRHPNNDEGWETPRLEAPGVETGPVNDNGTLAWRVRDAIDTTPQHQDAGFYQVVPTAAEHADAKANGWTFSSTLRLVDQTTRVEESTIGMVYRNGRDNYQLALGVENGAIHAMWVTKTFPLVEGPKVVLSGLDPNGYHTYEFVYDPLDDRTSLWVNSEERMRDLPPVFLDQSLIAWGALSSANTGEAYFSHVSFKIHKRNRALCLDGIDNLLSIPHSPAFGLESGFAIEAWVQPTRHTAERQVIVSRPRNAQGLPGVRLAYGTPNQAGVFEALLANDSNQVVITSPPVDRGAWHHVGIVHDGSTFSLFIDGEPAGETPANFLPHANNSPLYIGGEIVDGSKIHLFQGCVDDIRLWRAVRSARDFRERRYVQILGDESDLAGHWSFEDDLDDTSAFSHVATPDGTVAFAADEEAEDIEVRPLMEVVLPSSKVGNHYQLQYLDAPFTSGHWQNAGLIVGGTGGSISLFDDTATPCRWYRVFHAHDAADPGEQGAAQLFPSTQISVQTGSPFSQYRVQYARDSDPDTWINLSELFQGNGTRVRVIDVPRGEQRTYRVQRFTR